MRQCTIDDRVVICQRAELIAGGTRRLKRGMMFCYEQSGFRYLARSLGHVMSKDGDGEPFDGIVAMVLAADASGVFERWIAPHEVTRIEPTPPTKMAAFFFAPELPYSAEEIRDLMQQGTMCERFIDGAPQRVAEFRRLAVTS